ncbi:MAG: hypothetical protein DRN15_07415 [Thermoprotei archaeon]|nr:MAG: hypothetical protein DRM97_05890 [Thermoprotei archaeon]RLF23047.1 MAG: hypothetical protein DRN15_07415 [Thermoprotei archaeon]
MSPLLKRKKEKKDIIELAIKFLEENPGEVELARYLELQSMPYDPPVMKFMDWLRTQEAQVNVDKYEALHALVQALRLMLSRGSVGGGGGTW